MASYEVVLLVVAVVFVLAGIGCVVAARHLERDAEDEVEEARLTSFLRQMREMRGDVPGWYSSRRRN